MKRFVLFATVVALSFATAVIGEYLKTLERYPNPKPVNLTEFGK